MPLLWGKPSFMSSFQTKFLSFFLSPFSRFQFSLTSVGHLKQLFYPGSDTCRFFCNFNFYDQVLPTWRFLTFPGFFSLCLSFTQSLVFCLQKSSFLTKVLPLVCFYVTVFLDFTLLLLISKKKNTCKYRKQCIFLGVSIVLCQVF